MKPVTAIAIVIVIVLLILGVIFWQLGLFEKKAPEISIEPTTEPITTTATTTPTDIAPITPTESSYPAAVEPAETTYTIKSGDSLWEIAKHCYNDGSKWKLIYDANKDKVPDQNRLKVGAVLTIPPVESHGTQEPASAATDRTGKQGTYYTVQKGDSLWKIAKKFYNDGNKTDLIVNANHDKLATKNSTLKIGWRLFIPKEGGSAPNNQPVVPPPAHGSDPNQPQDNVPTGTGE